MKNKVILFLTVFALLCSFSLHAQVNWGSRGTDFWLTFGENLDNRINLVHLQVRVVAGDQPTRVTLRFSQPSALRTFNLAPGEAFTYSFTPYEKSLLYNTATGVSNGSVRITADHPVMAYAFSQFEHSAAATYLLPAQSLGTEYYQISYTPGYFEAIRFADAYAVIATQDTTQVYHNGSLLATLNTGQVYYRRSNTDMTGAHITANKPVAFFALSQGARVPNSLCCADHMFEQLAPVQTWGKRFFVPRTNMQRERVRIVASQNNTNITQFTPGTLITGTGGQTSGNNLSAGQFIEIEITGQQGCYIVADKPVGVCSYLIGNGGQGSSDPAQAWIPPLEQSVKTALVTPFVANVGYAMHEHTHYALVITPTATQENTRVRIGSGPEQSLGTNWRANAASGMSYHNYLLSNKTAAYLFSNPAGLMVMGYGIAPEEGYFYLLSSAMRTIDAFFYVNDVHFQEVYEVICEQPVHFRNDVVDGRMSTEEGHLKWFIDDDEVEEVRDQVEWERHFVAGVYKIKMEVIMEDGELRIRETSITIETPELSQPPSITLCAGDTVPTISFTGINIANVSWTAPNGTRIGLPSNTGTGDIQSFRAVNNSTVTDSVTITVTPFSPNGCEGEPKTFKITVNPLPVLNPLRDTTLCAGDTVPSISFTGSNVNSIIWEAINGTTIGMNPSNGTGNIPGFTTTNTTAYSQTATILVTPYSSADCKGVTRTFTITVDPLPILNSIQNIAFCPGEEVPEISFGSNAHNFIWEAPDGITIGMNLSSGTGNIPGFTATNNTDQTQLVTVTVTPRSDSKCEGKEQTFTITVYQKELLAVDLGNDTIICQLDSLLLNADHPNADSYQWHDDHKGATYIAYNMAGDYWVIVKSRCNQAEDTIKVTHFINPTVNLGKDMEFCPDDVIYREFNVTTPGVISYLWQDGSTEPVYIVEDTGVYRVTVSNACISVWDEIEIRVKDCSVLELWIPNAFAPNGVNDIFKPEVNNQEFLIEYEMAIYDRWGQLIFLTQDYQKGWDGKHKNRDCRSGIYTAVIKYKDHRGSYFTKTTSVTLLR